MSETVILPQRLWGKYYAAPETVKATELPEARRRGNKNRRERGKQQEQRK